MGYLYWIGALIIIAPLFLGLPLLSGNRVYRTATLFAGMSAGIVTFSFFINILRWGAGPAYTDQFYIYFAHTLPSFYIAALIIGSTIVSRYYLTASTRIATISAILGSLCGIYLLSMITARLLEILSITIKEGFPSSDILYQIMIYFMTILSYPDLSFVVLIFVSTFIALNGTAAAMQISNKETSREEAEQSKA